MDAIVGITFGVWMRLLRENSFAVDRDFWGRGAYLTAMSLLNSRARWLEERQYGEKVRNVQIEPPLFILGHWRNGTTLLHNMLVLDEQFAYANLFNSPIRVHSSGANQRWNGTWGMNLLKNPRWTT